MQNKFYIDSFEPIKLKKANSILEKHFEAAQEYREINKTFQQSTPKEGFWTKILNSFKHK